MYKHLNIIDSSQAGRPVPWHKLLNVNKFWCQEYDATEWLHTAYD